MVYGFNRSTFVMTLILDWSSKQAFTAHLKTCHISSELVWKGLHQEEEQVVSFFLFFCWYFEKRFVMRILTIRTNLGLLSWVCDCSTPSWNPVLVKFYSPLSWKISGELYTFLVWCITHWKKNCQTCKNDV